MGFIKMFDNIRPHFHRIAKEHNIAMTFIDDEIKLFSATPGQVLLIKRAIIDANIHIKEQHTWMDNGYIITKFIID